MRIQNTFTILFITLICISCSSDDNNGNDVLIFPSFGAAIDVTINGLSFDAMEPFISPDGNTIFFNSLNDGEDTKLYYATKVNDFTFDFVGEVSGANQTTMLQLNAVADLDANGNFYWTSTRNYPAELDNLFRGSYSNGAVTDIARVQGNFNKDIPGWLVMDHGISLDGQFLYFNNARFDADNCQGPCETEIGIAQKTSEISFSTISNSEMLLQNINDTNYIYYAPCITSDNLEFYYTRYLKGMITPNTTLEICVAVRNDMTASFSMPRVLFSESISSLIEAPTLTVDKSKMYYHQKTTNSHKLVLRYRE